MLLLLGSLVVLLILGVPVAYSLGLSALAYFVFYEPSLIVVLPQKLYAGMESYSMIALPLFILMGVLMNYTGITVKIIDLSMVFFGRFRGGLGYVNVFTSMIFGGISGSSASDTASVGAILIPTMEQRGYSKGYASGITLASATMGMIIPPSIPMVLYGVTSETSIGKLFLSSLIPGIMIGLIMLGINLIMALRYNLPKERVSTSFKDIALQVKSSLLALIMPLFVVGSVVFGIATSTESAGIGVLYTLILGFLVFRKLTLKQFYRAVLLSMVVSASIMIIIAISQMYIWIFTLERIPQMLAAFVTNMNVSLTLTLLVINVIILIAGTFVDVSPAILLLTPIFLPVVQALGGSPLHFGAILITGLAVGTTTPPVGTCLNVVCSISRLGMGAVFKGTAPFLIANLITLLLITLFPVLTTWLPELVVRTK